MSTKRKPKKAATRTKRKPVHNAHSDVVTIATKAAEAPPPIPELVFPAGTFTSDKALRVPNIMVPPDAFAPRPGIAPRLPDRSFWQRVGDFFRGKP